MASLRYMRKYASSKEGAAARYAHARCRSEPPFVCPVPRPLGIGVRYSSVTLGTSLCLANGAQRRRLAVSGWRQVGTRMATRLPQAYFPPPTHSPCHNRDGCGDARSPAQSTVHRAANPPPDAPGGRPASRCPTPSRYPRLLPWRVRGSARGASG